MFVREEHAVCPMADRTGDGGTKWRVSEEELIGQTLMRKYANDYQTLTGYPIVNTDTSAYSQSKQPAIIALETFVCPDGSDCSPAIVCPFRQ